MRYRSSIRAPLAVRQRLIRVTKLLSEKRAKRLSNAMGRSQHRAVTFRGYLANGVLIKSQMICGITSVPLLELGGAEIKMER